MFSLFKKSSEEKTDSTTLEQNEDQKVLADSVYKKNIELGVKNKTLSILSKLYEISILALESKDLAARICQTVQVELSFELVSILLCSEDCDEFTPIALANSERLHDVRVNFESLGSAILLTSFLQKIISDKKMNYTDKLADVWDTLIPKEMFDQITSDGHIKSSIVYPLITGDKVIGVILFSLNREYDDLLDYEKTSIESFINVVAVALDKSLLSEQLTVSNDKLQEANEGQASLMHFMNHQIKGRFGNTKNIFAELLTGDYGEMPPDTKPLLLKGLDEATTGINYVQGILRGASAESGKLPYEMKPFDLKPLAEDVAKRQKEYAEKKGLKFDFTVGDGEYMVTGDMLQLSEAMRNLIDNSINYTIEGSISVSLTCTTSSVLLTVKDTGVGITEEDKPHLFKSGGRGVNSLKVNTNATGYGLAFVKGVVEAHKGRVWVDSAGAGQGSTFYMELPRG